MSRSREEEDNIKWILCQVIEQRRTDLQNEVRRLLGTREAQNIWFVSVRNVWYQIFNSGTNDKVAKLNIYIDQLNLLQKNTSSEVKTASSDAEHLLELEKLVDRYEILINLSSYELSVQRYGWWHTFAGKLVSVGAGAGIGFAFTFVFAVGGPLGAIIGMGMGFVLSFTRPVEKFLLFGNSARGEDNVKNPVREIEQSLPSGIVRLDNILQKIKSISSNVTSGNFLGPKNRRFYVEKSTEDKELENKGCTAWLRKKLSRNNSATVAVSKETPSIQVPNPNSLPKFYITQSGSFIFSTVPKLNIVPVTTQADYDHHREKVTVRIQPPRPSTA